MTTCKERPTVLYDEDGHPSLVSVEYAPTARQAARIAFTEAYKEALFDYCGTFDVHGDGSVYRPVLSEYRAFLNQMRRVWHCPSLGSRWSGYEAEEIWMPCTAPGLPGAIEFWTIPK